MLLYRVNVKCIRFTDDTCRIFLKLLWIRHIYVDWLWAKSKPFLESMRVLFILIVLTNFRSVIYWIIISVECNFVGRPHTSVRYECDKNIELNPLWVVILTFYEGLVKFVFMLFIICWIYHWFIDHYRMHITCNH